MAKNRTRGGGLHELPSGLIHLSDSSANLPRGEFIDHFGAPPDPKDGPSRTSSSGSYPGRAPYLNTRFMAGKGKK